MLIHSLAKQRAQRRRQLTPEQLIERLPRLKYQKWIQRALATLLHLTEDDLDRLDWKILAASLQDMERGVQGFYPYRHIRKVTLFGSARLPNDSPEYRMALEFANRITQEGFMVITGAGGGIMQAGNEGAGPEHSFGLDIQLPFEHDTNPFIDAQKLINFKYFFTRKLFFLRESDAIALFPGGFGTQDEAFECLTLSQTGKFGPAPLILIDRPGGDYWHDWDRYVRKHLLQTRLIGDNDRSLYTITNSPKTACQTITRFYQVYHSLRYVGEKLVIRLQQELSNAKVEQLNATFSDILVRGKIEKSQVLPQEVGDGTESLPRLVLYFNQHDLGRLYQLIAKINQVRSEREGTAHPERR